MSTTLRPESKTFLQEYTFSGESTQHFHNIWTSCNNCLMRNLQMHTSNYDIVINIGDSEVVIGSLYSYVVRRTIFTTRKGFVAISRKCWTDLEQNRAKQKSWKLVPCQEHVEQKSYYCRPNLQRNLLRLFFSLVHGEKRGHITAYRRCAHEIVRHQFNISSTFVPFKFLPLLKPRSHCAELVSRVFTSTGEVQHVKSSTTWLHFLDFGDILSTSVWVFFHFNARAER
jgi:hypothetical protein